MTTATPIRETVICPICFEPISRTDWDSIGCCLTPSEREEIQ